MGLILIVFFHALMSASRATWCCTLSDAIDKKNLPNFLMLFGTLSIWNVLIILCDS